jgi:hypothetical protein
MANVFTDLADAQRLALLNGADRPSATNYGGGGIMQAKKTSYTAATADPLYICLLPKGSIVDLSLCQLKHGDAGDAATCKLGLFTVADTPAAIDDDAYGAGLALGGSAGRKVLDEAATPGDYFTTPTRLTQDAWLVATWTTVTNGASHDQYWTIVTS